MTPAGIDFHDFETLRKLDFESLAEILADQSSAVQFGSGEPTKDEKRHLGRAIFEDAVKALRPHICKSGGVITRATRAEETTIVTSIADLVVSVCSGLPVLVITTMIIKYGLDRICNESK